MRGELPDLSSLPSCVVKPSSVEKKKKEWKLGQDGKFVKL